jgi:endoglucanase
MAAKLDDLNQASMVALTMRKCPMSRSSIAFPLLSAAAALGCAAPPAPSAPESHAPASISTTAAPSAPGNLLSASDFEDGKSVPWTSVFSAPAEGASDVRNGAYCVTVRNVGVKRWDAQFRHRDIVIEKGHTYTVSFKAWASVPTKARPKVGMSGPPYAEYWSSVIELATSPQAYLGRFTMMQQDDATAEFAFHIGGDMAQAPVPFELCIDDVHLDDPEFRPAPKPVVVAATPNLAVNQVGYFPHGIKIATLKSAAPTALEWQLVERSGRVLDKGHTKAIGEDPASGERVHVIDFTSAKAPGEGVVLRVGDEVSAPFDIATNLYSRLKNEALAYFYQNRSGIEITMPYAGNPALARPAGHLSDKSVPCLAGSGCDYKLDVAGGWYDAGDHGKYVVNGGISLWTLLNLYERTKYLGSSLADFGDGKLPLPENKNNVPDLLDEARWEMEFLLKMQVPDGKPLAGMAHHKVHDDTWTALAVAPHEDTVPRSLHKPSTAATLNLAATAAQSARIWMGIDAPFAARCLHAAERAWAAARQNPAIFAAASDNQGGGAYADDKVADEFYWAAAELYVTTGKAEYKQFLASSPLNPRLPLDAGGHTSSLNWQRTEGLGMISMAIVPGKVDKAWQKTMRARIREAADRFRGIEDREGYRTPLERTADGRYLWGSNSFVLNNMLVMALAYDFSKEPRYLEGVVLGMDYLLGRNPLGQSYVTGYGSKPLQNPHHRFWAFQANPKYPKPPAGVISGGPNSSIDDPYSKGAGLRGCVAEKCFVDNIEAWSVNEVTINWNAPFAWTSAWLDEKSRK